PHRGDVVDVPGLFTSSIGMSDDEALLLREAEFRERARGDESGALDIYRRLETQSKTSDPTPQLARLCALRIGTLAARAGREDEARRELGFAAAAEWTLWDPTGVHVRAAALYELATLDLAHDRSEGVDALLPDLGHGGD